DEIAVQFGWNNGSKYLAVKLRLTGEVLHFIREQKFNFSDYDSLKKILIERYTIQSNKASFLHEFFTYQPPPNMPVSVYFAKASALSFKAFCTGERNGDIEEANRIEMLKSMLLTNLAPEIRRGFIAANPKTIDEIKEAALLQEREWNSYRLSPSCSVSNKTYPIPVYAVQVRAENTNQCVKNFCQKLAEKIETSTTKVTNLSRQQSKQQLCYSCTRPGHIARYGRNSHSSNYPNVLPPPSQQLLRPSYPDSENIRQKLVPTLVKEDQQPEAKREAVEKSSKVQSSLKVEEMDRTLEAEISVRERETSPLLKSEWSPKIDYVEIRNKHIEGKTFERAQKRRVQEVKNCEQNKRFAHEKSKSFEKCNKANDMDIDNADNSRRSSESRVDKYPNRNSRRMDSNIGDRSQHTQFLFSRQFRQNVPLRFQKQKTKFCRQKFQRTVVIPSSQSGPARFMPSYVRFSLFKSRKKLVD
ncbi:hypothetical protein AVEN_193826-1, partial [Araneus ventricosus]